MYQMIRYGPSYELGVHLDSALLILHRESGIILVQFHIIIIWQLTYIWRALMHYYCTLDDSVLSAHGVLHCHMTWRWAVNDSTTTRNLCSQWREASLLLLKSNCHTYLPYLDYRCRIYYVPVFILWIVLIGKVIEST